MLAFMASRNVRESMAVVHEGRAVFALPQAVAFHIAHFSFSGHNSLGVPFYSVVIN